MHSLKEKEKENDSRQIRQVECQVPHRFYNAADNVNDLMLLKVRRLYSDQQSAKESGSR